MTRLPVRVRLTLVFAVATALVLAGAGAFVYGSLRADLTESVDDGLRARAQAGTTAVVDPEDTYAEALAPGERSRVLTPAEQERVAGPRTVLVERRIPGVDGVARVHARARDGGVIVVVQSLADRNETLRGLLRAIAVGAAGAVLLASAIGYGLATAALRPVEGMRRRASQITHSDSDRLPLPDARDEIRRLGETLNAMLDRLSDSYDRERRFVADASHELRTPIAVIKTELETALRSGDREAVVAAIEECDALAQLAEDLLTLARTSDSGLPIAREPVDARSLLEGIRARFADRARHSGRRIEIDAPTGLTLDADPLRLRQALSNLVDNALRHGAGTVTLSARAGEVSVADEGPGFGALTASAFERFSRGDEARAGSGAGLGLAIVRTIAQAHGGEARIDGARVGVTTGSPPRAGGYTRRR